MADNARPKRQSAVMACAKIQSVLEWESMSRHHPTYIAVEDAINAEFDREGKSKKAKTEGEEPIEYDVMSDSSAESMEDASEDCVYEPCADSVDSAEEEDVRSESSICSSGMESLPVDDDSDTSVVDFSADGGTTDEDTEDEAYMYDEDDEDDEDECRVDPSTAVDVVEPQETLVDLSSDVVFNAVGIEADEIPAQHASQQLLSTVLLSDVVSHAKYMLSQNTEPAVFDSQPDAAYEPDADVESANQILLG
jgi:hypothetical protein